MVASTWCLPQRAFTNVGSQYSLVSSPENSGSPFSRHTVRWHFPTCMATCFALAENMRVEVPCFVSSERFKSQCVIYCLFSPALPLWLVQMAAAPSAWERTQEEDYTERSPQPTHDSHAAGVRNSTVILKHDLAHLSWCRSWVRS